MFGYCCVECNAWQLSNAGLPMAEPQDGTQPWFITKPKSVMASLGQHALLSCAIAGDPFPRFQWRKGSQPLSSGVDYEVLEKEDVVSLLIRRVKAHHAGDYEISLKYNASHTLFFCSLWFHNWEPPSARLSRAATFSCVPNFPLYGWNQRETYLLYSHKFSYNTVVYWMCEYAQLTVGELWQPSWLVEFHT